ncbi:hypothetical protein DCS_00955 [Drechmeria coniospora]|uniref:Uncharacterized protein n=1 Tax=Drechmeria coniospora TaxID=98403 RepID=A0A151GRY3_DRECN|nr:hypothetical protein DCS_00955 [Drechmeria coniospora]KYK59821.1 hypothetical protein DCS_00955 [Drechmeria coniospora]
MVVSSEAHGQMESEFDYGPPSPSGRSHAMLTPRPDRRRTRAATRYGGASLSTARSKTPEPLALPPQYVSKGASKGLRAPGTPCGCNSSSANLKQIWTRAVNAIPSQEYHDTLHIYRAHLDDPQIVKFVLVGGRPLATSFDMLAFDFSPKE